MVLAHTRQIFWSSHIPLKRYHIIVIDVFFHSLKTESTHQSGAGVPPLISKN